MSAEERAQSRQGREAIQIMIEEGWARVSPAMIAREERLVRLDALDSEGLHQEANNALGKLAHRGNESVELSNVLSELITANYARNKLFEDPQNIEEVYPRINAIFETGLNKLVKLGFWTRS